jgi:iron complex outermembrane receptor protein
MKCSIQFLFFLLVCSYNIVHGQDFIGTVLNGEDKSPVPFATVYFSELESGTSTSNEGVFLIEHYPQKKIAISISSVGFKTLDVVLDLSKISTQTFYLQPTHIKLEEVIVSVPGGKLKDATVANVSKSNLSELNSTSAFTLSDAISNMAGVDQITTGARIGKPVIRGLSGSRIVTYTQGVRVENQQWGEEHALGVGSDKLPLEISLGIKNLFNTTYIDHLSRFKSIGIPMVGRSFYIGAKLAINKKLNFK